MNKRKLIPVFYNETDRIQSVSSTKSGENSELNLEQHIYK